MLKLGALFYIITLSLIIIVWYSLSSKNNSIHQLKALAIHDWSTSQLASSQVPSSSWLVWTGQYPEKFKQLPITNVKRKQSGYFLHITDMHVDVDYLEGATVQSVCHELPDLSISKKKKPSQLAGKYGTPGQRCDAPILLAEETLKWISKEWKDKLDFVIWTGDNAKHNWDKKHNKRKRRDVYELNQRVTEMMLETFWIHDKIPVVPSFGNNDVYPHNRIGGADTDGDLLMFYEQLWRAWIPLDQRSTFRQGGGYFMVQVAPHLHVISLNTMYFYTKNRAVHNCLHPDSPATVQFRWFEEQLKWAQKHESGKEKIYVIGHVPPSPRDYKGTCMAEYLRLATAYSDVILGHFFAHLNMDHFLLFDSRHNEDDDDKSAQTCNMTMVEGTADKDDDHELFHTNRDIESYLTWLRKMYEKIEPSDDKTSPPDSHASLVAIQVAPSVLPVYYPSIRIYKYKTTPDDNEGNTTMTESKPYGALLSYSQYFANLTKWNTASDEEKNLEYEFEYSTAEAYHMKDLSPESFFELAKSMVTDSEKGHQLWSNFRNHMLVKTQTFE
ncbi:Metallo-dependent phosphatase-like protein [Cokeromyces recurvatus]|uniref:Metallo-dependent phosphatase-like protein n=1 Tax=Cokeromyces recurvatus TaxID=90255 RepID=UPI0022201911|nr:Metallo-dependent phosphatase-like protein [Cokeromyces recurvatus]KAI7901134.1 Metallo-dependent phosphatase-like protein [Cokeromyces recurvatus]